MNRIGSGLVVTVVVAMVSMMAADAFAQAEGQRRARGPGGGMMMNQSTLLAADALLLPEAHTAKLVKADEDARQSVMAELIAGRESMRDMTREQREQKMAEVQAAISESVVEAMSDDLAEEELAGLEAILAKNVIRPIVELRALRMVSLTDAQRETIQPYAIAAAKALPEMRGRGGMRGGPGGERGGDRGGQRGGDRPESDSEEAKAFETAKSAWMDKTNATLTSEQKQTWEDNIATVEEEMSNARQRFRGGGRQ